VILCGKLMPLVLKKISCMLEEKQQGLYRGRMAGGGLHLFIAK